MQLLKTIVLTVVFIWGLGQAFHYGAIWDGQAHPTQNVKISSTAANITMEGELIPLWNGQYRLISGDRSIDFSLDKFTMEIKHDGTAGRSVYARWRSFVPAALLLAIYAMACLAAITRLDAQRKANETAGSVG